MAKSAKATVVREALERFTDISTLAIAKYLILEHPDLFDGNLDTARQMVRYHRGEKKGGSGYTKDPILRDIPIPKSKRIRREPYILPEGLWLVINDLHVPFHEEKPIEVTIQYAQSEKIDGLFINGDFQDCHAVTYWPSVTKRDFDAEIIDTIDMLDFLRKELKPKYIVYKPGNHEERLPRRFAEKLPDVGLSMGGIIAQTELLGFESRKIEYLDYKQIVMAGELPILHGHELQNISRAVNPARGLFMRTKSWAMCGHCHSTSENPAKSLLGILLTTWSVGCLCDLSPDYNPYGNDWNWGFALINVEKDGNFEVVNKRILSNGRVA